MREIAKVGDKVLYEDEHKMMSARVLAVASTNDGSSTGPDMFYLIEYERKLWPFSWTIQKWVGAYYIKAKL